MSVDRSRVGNVLAEVTGFVGRRHELSRARQLLGVTRLLTLTGIGGIGKSRLALRTAHNTRRCFADGAWMVDLAPLDDGDLLAQTVLIALGLDHDSTRPAVPVLTEHLAHRRSLLVLDNCEHLLNPCATLIRALLEASPGLRILTTSRQALGIDGESLLTVPPLTTPDPDRPPPLENMTGYEAVRLFVDRATAVLGEFALREDHRAPVARICHRLDGIPLAIELATAWVRFLSPQQILDRLDDRFDLLTRGSRAAPPRHQTLRAAIDRSFELCTPTERRLWTRASVFRGGFDLEAAQAVCVGEEVGHAHVLPAVAGLVDKSVLTREDDHGTVRYRMLDTLRHYGRSRLREDGEEPTVRQRHRDHYRRLAARANADWFSPRQTAWFTRLRLDHANLRGAVEYCLNTPGEARAGLDMAASLWSHRLGAGGLEEERRWLTRALALDTGPSTTRAEALRVDGWLAHLRGDTAAARDRLAECRALADDLGDPRARAHTVQFAGLAALFQDDVTAAIPLLEDALEGHRAADDLGAQWTALFLLALANCLARTPRATALAEQCLALCDAHDARWSRAYALWLLGLRHWLDGDNDRAVALLRNALDIDQPAHNLLAVTQSLEVLAWATAREGAHRQAALLLGAAQALWQRVGVAAPGLGPLLRHRCACEAELQRSLGPAAFATAVRTGAALTLDGVIGCVLGRPPRSPVSPETGPAAPLTRRERQIVELIGEGLTDRQIAERLVISPRTAEGHVQRILVKLGFTSRVQIAAWAATPPAAHR